MKAVNQRCGMGPGVDASAMGTTRPWKLPGAIGQLIVGMARTNGSNTTATQQDVTLRI